jgi:hypothetical protein
VSNQVLRQARLDQTPAPFEHAPDALACSRGERAIRCTWQTARHQRGQADQSPCVALQDYRDDQ